MNRTQKMILIFLAVAVVVLSAAAIFVIGKVNAVKFNITATFEPMDYRDGILIAKDSPKAMRFVTNMGTYRELDVAVFDVQNYSGAENLSLSEVIAYHDAGNIIPMSGNALPYYNLDNCFIYGIKGQEKYLVNTDERTVVPLLSRSSINVEGVCTSGEFLLENDGKTITVLQRKDRTTNEIISEKTITFKEEYTSLEFVAWYNERYAVIRLGSADSTSFAIVDGLGGAYAIAATTNDMPAFLTESLKESEDNPCEGMLECYNTLISHKYLQCYKNVQDIMRNTYEQYPSGGYVDIFSGVRYESGLDRENFVGQNKLISVSDDASYALFKTSLASDPHRNIEYVIFNSANGKYYTLTDILGSEAFIDDAFFVYNNVLFVNFADINTGKESSCSIKLSF